MHSNRPWINSELLIKPFLFSELEGTICDPERNVYLIFNFAMKIVDHYRCKYEILCRENYK
jgi:hypothetical protein